MDRAGARAHCGRAVAASKRDAVVRRTGSEPACVTGPAGRRRAYVEPGRAARDAATAPFLAPLARGAQRRKASGSRARRALLVCRPTGTGSSHRSGDRQVHRGRRDREGRRIAGAAQVAPRPARFGRRADSIAGEAGVETGRIVSCTRHVGHDAQRPICDSRAARRSERGERNCARHLGDRRHALHRAASCGGVWKPYP